MQFNYLFCLFYIQYLQRARHLGSSKKSHLEMENVFPHIDLSGLSAHPDNEIEGDKQEICPAKTIQ